MSDPSSQDPQRAKAPIVAGRDTRYHDVHAGDRGVSVGGDIHGNIQTRRDIDGDAQMDWGLTPRRGFVRVLAFLAGLLIILVAVIVFFNVLT